MSSESGSDVHHGLKRRVKLFAKAIDRQWVDRRVGRTVLHDTTRLQDLTMSGRRRSLAIAQVTAAFKVVGPFLCSGSGSDSDSG